MIGATTSQSLDLTLLNKGDMVYGTSTIKVEIGLKIGNTIEYIPMGIYNIDDIEKTDYTIKITAFDNMMKFEKNFISNLGDTLTLQQVVNELVRITGVQFTGTLPSYSVKKLDGFSCREVLSYVASICGGNSVITRDGEFTIVIPKDNNYAIGTANYFDYTREESEYKIGKISCQVADKVLSKGSLGADSMELEFENPWVTTTILNDIYTKLNGFEYLGYSMKWQGDLALDAGDIVTITDKKGVVRKHPILLQKFTYTGGLTSEISAKGENKNKNEFSGSGPSTKKIERVVTELAIVNKALIGVAYIDDLTAGNIKFDTASGTVMDLQTLLAKFVTGENGQFLNLTTDNVVIANAVIKDAMIDSLSLNKLKAGTIDTNKITLASADGGLSIVGPTMQFKDKSNKVRLQLGQDTQGNFNFILRGEDGTTTLIDHTGIKEKAIADNLIKSNMVAENAIGEKQINYSSLVTGLNKDTNTNLIQASKVAIDLTGQSLEVSFNSLKSTVEGINSTVESNTTAITVAQGKIEGLIKESTITKGDVTTLKDNYTSIKATVDGINSTVSSHTSSIGTLNSNVSTMQSSITQLNNKIDLKVEATEVNTIVNNAIDTVDTKIETTNNKVANIETNLSSVTQRVSSTESTVNTINGNVTNLTSRVSTAESKLTATSLTTTISSAISGGASTITTTQFVMDKTGLTIKNGALNIKNKAGETVLQGDANGNLKLSIFNSVFEMSATGQRKTQMTCDVLDKFHIKVPFQNAGAGFKLETDTGKTLIEATAGNDYLSIPHYTRVSSLTVDGGANVAGDFAIKKTKMTHDSNGKFVMNIPFDLKNEGFLLKTSTNKNLIEITSGGDGALSIPIWTRLSSLSVTGDAYVATNFSVGGSKNSLQKTENFGKRLINAYETAEYYFADIGSGVINNDGECLIYIDDILQECINTECEYHVFTQIYSGAISKIERFNNYFIVYGKEGTKFSWELKAKRLGYENVRLDAPEIPTFSEECIIEDILIEELDFKLEDILMEVV